MEYDIPDFLEGMKQIKKVYGFKPLSDWYVGKTRNQIISAATPSWVDKKAIKQIYLTAKMLSLQTGRRYEVDHIVPLKSSVVCGLHVEWNLQVVARDNNRGLKNEFQQPVPFNA